VSTRYINAPEKTLTRPILWRELLANYCPSHGTALLTPGDYPIELRVACAEYQRCNLSLPRFYFAEKDFLVRAVLSTRLTDDEKFLTESHTGLVSDVAKKIAARVRVSVAHLDLTSHVGSHRRGNLLSEIYEVVHSGIVDRRLRLAVTCENARENVVYSATINRPWEWPGDRAADALSQKERGRLYLIWRAIVPNVYRPLFSARLLAADTYQNFLPLEPKRAKIPMIWSVWDVVKN
jgi:hypothetical protein